MRVFDKLYWYPENGLLDSNTYLIDDELTVLIDPGLDRYLPNLIEAMRKDGFSAGDIDLITITHIHIDHSSSGTALKERAGAKIAIHELHERYFGSGERMASFFGMSFDLEYDLLLGDSLSTGDMGLEIYHTPGHSQDSICFYSREKRVLICGDLIFAKSVGRTDLPGGSGDKLRRSIERVSKLDIEYLLPGHMGVIQGRKDVIQNINFIKRFFFPII